MKVNVVDIKGKETGRQVELPDGLFNIEPNTHVMYLAVKQFLANQRQGTAQTRERGEIRGSTRKIKRQKGTGTARAGSIKNPLFRGGGRVFGPRPRDYRLKLNKKVKALARASALSTKAQNEGVMVVEDFSFDKPKTKAYVDIMRNLGLENEKTLHLISDYDVNLHLSMRNIPKKKLRRVKDLTTYEIMEAKKMIFAESAIDVLNQNNS